jgi:hypothetical protein
MLHHRIATSQDLQFSNMDSNFWQEEAQVAMPQSMDNKIQAIQMDKDLASTLHLEVILQAN